MAILGVIGSLALPMLIHNWILMAVVLFFWGGCVSGLYTVGLAHLGARLSGADLAAANAAYIFCYAVGTVVGPQGIGAAMDVVGNDGYAWALASFFGFYVLIALCRTLFHSKRS
jgi:MFS family permease